MTTGAELASFDSKKIIGRVDFEDRMLRYLQQSGWDSTARLFIKGTFDLKCSLTGLAQQFRIELNGNGEAKVHDGAGRIIDLAAISRDVLFENTAAVTYEIGARYIEAPSGIAINPRNGKPQFVKKIEAIGTEADPNGVTNNGSTLTFDVDSLFEASGTISDNAQRLVRVFKKTPADGALTEPVAIQTIAIVYGGVNEITTADLMGQSVASVDPADYTVQLVGPIVLRDTASNRPSNQSDAWFGGTAVGVGGAGIPVVFDITGQGLILAQSAALTSLNPFTKTNGQILWGIAATDVQAGIEELVSDLQIFDVTNDTGAHKIGIDRQPFGTRAFSTGGQDWGGLDPASPANVGQQLINIDENLLKRTFGATVAPSLEADTTEIVVTGLAPHWLKGFSDHSLGLYGPADGLPIIIHPNVRGAHMETTKVFADSYATNFDINGSWECLTMGTKDVSGDVLLGNKSSFHGRDLWLAPNTFDLSAGADPDSVDGLFLHSSPSSLRSSVVGKAVTGSVGTQAHNFRTNSTGQCHGPRLIENVFFDEGDAGDCLNMFGSSSDKAPLLFVNCLFRQTRDDDKAATISGNATFVDCRFVKTSLNDDAPCVSVSSDEPKFIGCRFYAENGYVLTSGTSANPSFTNCQFEAGDSVSTNTNGGRFIDVTASSTGLSRSALFDDCKFVIGLSCVKPTTGTVANLDLSNCWVRNCKIDSTVLTNYHLKPIVRSRGSKIYGLDLQFGTGSTFSASPSGIGASEFGFIETDAFGTSGWTELHNVRMYGRCEYDQTHLNYSLIVMVTATTASNLDLLAIVHGQAVTNAGMDGIVRIGSRCSLEGVKLYGGVAGESLVTWQLAAAAAAFELVGNHSRLSDVIVNGAWDLRSADTGGDVFAAIRSGVWNAIVEDINCAEMNPDDTAILIEGEQCSVRNNVLHSGDSATRFIRSTANAGQGHCIADNNLSNDTNPANTSWINLDLGDCDGSMISGNVCRNEGAVVPVIQNGGAASIGDGNNNVLRATAVVSQG